MTWEDYLQAIIALLVIVDPVGRPLFFAMLTKEMDRQQRRKAIGTVVTSVAVILIGTALVGKVLLETIGIDLGAFSFVGGLIVAIMGFEMMAGGESSRVQGGKEAHQPPKVEDQLIVPFTMPFIAGPGAITVVITIASQTDGMDSIYVALTAVVVSVIALFFGFTVLSDLLSKISERAIEIATRFGGLIIATIGTQLALGGIKHFFNLG